MAPDRQRIQKEDFPIRRRGYDPDAVDAHLRLLADEIDELERSAGRRSESLAEAASQQVRSILKAAEASAAEIQRQAEDDAGRIRAEAREYVGRVSESTAAMLERIVAVHTELHAMIESLRTGSNRLNADLQLLEGNLSTVKNDVVPRPQFDPEQSAGVAPPGGGEVLTGPATVPATSGTPNGGDDLEGARLVALNMAMDGRSREETERYLAEHFRLTEHGQLLDDIYAAVGG